MNNFYPAATIILAEICAALLVLSGIMIFVMLRNRGRNHAALSQLTDKLKQNESERLTSLKTILKDSYHYADDKIDDLATGIINAEMVFYQQLMDTFSSRNGASLENLAQKFNAVIYAYSFLVPQPGSSTAGDTDPESVKVEMAHLTKQNEKLAKEINAMKAAMEETNEEFMRAFTGRQLEEAKAESAAQATADVSDDVPDTPAVPETLEATPEETATPDAASPEINEKNPETQAEPAQSADNEKDDVEDVLKNIDIDLGDINLDDDEADEANNEPSSSANKKDENTEISADKANKGASDKTANAPAQAGTVDTVDNNDVIVAREKTA